MTDNKTTEWVSIILNVVIALFSIGFSIASCHYAQKADKSAQNANQSAAIQASAAFLEHYPYLAIVSHMDNGNKQHGIYIHNYSSGLAIIESISIDGEYNPNLTSAKWKEILKLHQFSDNEILCFSFSMPNKNIGSSGNGTVPLIFVASDIENDESENYKKLNQEYQKLNLESSLKEACTTDLLQQKLEKIDIKIRYKSRFADSKIEEAKIFKLF